MNDRQLTELERLARLPEPTKSAFIAYYAALYAYRRKYPR